MSPNLPSLHDVAAPEVRRKSDIASMAALLTVFLQLAAGVWYVAKVDAILTQLQAVSSELKQSAAASNAISADHAQRIRVLELQRQQDDRRTERLEEVLRDKGIL